jgi:hypothetical protein
VGSRWRERGLFLARLVLGAVGVLWAFTTAIGSGVNDVLNILGFTMNPAQQVFAGAVVFGVALLWDNALLRSRLSSHSGAPNLLWQGVRVAPASRGDGFELTVTCRNDGQTARIDRASEVGGTHTYSFSDSRPVPFTIRWDGFDDGGYIETGVFQLVMLCDTAEEAADHKVSWRIVYWDPHLRHAYVSECSTVVRFIRDKPSIVPPPHLDPTSPDERNKKYNREYRPGASGHSLRLPTR